MAVVAALASRGARPAPRAQLPCRWPAPRLRRLVPRLADAHLRRPGGSSRGSVPLMARASLACLALVVLVACPACAPEPGDDTQATSSASGRNACFRLARDSSLPDVARGGGSAWCGRPAVPGHG